MEITSSSVTSSLKLALDVVTNQKRPVLEIYWEVTNRISPPHEYQLENKLDEYFMLNKTYRIQDISVDFYLINIGGVRAENLGFRLIGDFVYLIGNKKLSDIRLFRDIEINQFAPAQKMYLFRIPHSDLYNYDEDGRPHSVRDKPFTIQISYDGPKEIANKIQLWWANVRGKNQYKIEFTFNPIILDGFDLPPPQYS